MKTAFIAAKEKEKFLPNFWAVVLEKLQEFGDHDVKRTIQHVAVQDLGGVLTDLLQRPERSLKTTCKEKKKCEGKEKKKIGIKCFTTLQMWGINKEFYSK